MLLLSVSCSQNDPENAMVFHAIQHLKPRYVSVGACRSMDASARGIAHSGSPRFDARRSPAPRFPAVPHISPSLRTGRGEAPAPYVLATFLTRGQGVCHVVRLSRLLLATLFRLLAAVWPKAELPLGANCFLGPKRCFRPAI